MENYGELWRIMESMDSIVVIYYCKWSLLSPVRLQPV